MGRKTKKQIELEATLKSGWKQLKMFCSMCHYARTNGAFGGNGITKQDLYNKGMTDEVWKWLVANHYCNEQKPGKPLWISINGNKFYPEQTIQNLEASMEEFELEMKKQGCPHTATCRNYYAGMCDVCLGENMLDEEK